MVLLKVLVSNSIAISDITLSCISTFTSIFSIIYKTDKQIIEAIFNTLSGYLTKVTSHLVSLAEGFDTDEKICHVQSLLLTTLVTYA
jgi:hypothetical protein